MQYVSHNMPYTKRAAKACVWCHERKVRCDAATFGNPCTRCRQDDRNCIMRNTPPKIVGPWVPKAQCFNSPTSEPCSIPSHPEPVDISPQRQQSDLASGSGMMNHGLFSSYSFLELNGFSRMTPEDLAVLNSKGCLQLPDRGLLDEFVRQYFLNCHLITPVIDEAIFWEMYHNTEDKVTSKIPLLFFQAMLFASSPYVSLETAQGCGFEDGRAAWNTLYQKTKFLFHFTSGDGPLVRSQTALLLTFFSSAEEPQAASLWLTHAIQYGTTAYFQRCPHIDDEDRTLQNSVQNRLWWSILLRDRSLSLGLRRRAQVLSFELRMMKDLPQEEDFAAEIHGSHVYDSKTKRRLFVVFREQCQLAAILTEMVALIFGTHGLSLPILTRESLQDTFLIVNNTKTSLALWERGSCISPFRNTHIHNAAVKFTQLTMMYYQAARMNLAHYEACLIEKHSDFVGDNYIHKLSNVGSMLLDATTKMVHIMQYFSEKGQFQNLPLTLLGYVAMPLVLSAINFKLSSSEPEMAARRQPLQHLSEVMSYSRRVYDVGDFISSQTDAILHLAYLTCQEIFLRRSPHISPGQTTSSIPKEQSQIFSNISNHAGEMKITKGPANNWHDAFLRHPRAYLLISTTVDYFMSVGRLPQDSSLPDLVRSMPPMGRIRLPWAHNTAFPGLDINKKQCQETNEKGAQSTLWSPPARSREPEDEISPINTSRISHRSSQDELSSVDDLTTGNNQEIEQTDQVNLDYLSMSSPFSKVLGLPKSQTKSQSKLVIPSQPGSKHSLDVEKGQAGLWEPTESNTPYGDFMTALVQDCYGSAPHFYI